MDKDSDQKKHDLVLSGKKELVNSSSLVSRGLDLAKNITGVTKYKASLLWVDDDQDILSWATRFFSQKGYRITTFQNGFDALEELKKDDYDLLVTDVSGDKISGMDLLKKAREFKPKLMTMVFSGSAEYLKEEIKIMAFGCCVACIQKGEIFLERIEVIIEKALSIRRRLATLRPILKKKLKAKMIRAFLEEE